MRNIIHTTDGSLPPSVDGQMSNTAIIQLERHCGPCLLFQLQPPVNNCNTRIPMSNDDSQLFFVRDGIKAAMDSLRHGPPRFCLWIRYPIHRWMRHRKFYLLCPISGLAGSPAVAQFSQSSRKLRRQFYEFRENICCFPSTGQIAAYQQSWTPMEEIHQGLSSCFCLAFAKGRQMGISPSACERVDLMIRLAVPDKNQLFHRLILN